MKVLNLILCSAFVFSTMAIAKDTQTFANSPNAKRFQKMCDDGNKAMCEQAKLYNSGKLDKVYDTATSKQN